MVAKPQLPETQHYFVDESGDGVLFDNKKRVVLGKEGFPNFFMIGAISVVDPIPLTDAFNTLWRDVLADKYLNVIPSIRKRNGQMTAFFHATDDPPEVRQAVFKLILSQDIKFYAVIKDMQAVLNYVRNRNEADPTYRYNTNELYDFTIRRLFPDKLHQSNSYIVHFAKRGNRDRSLAIQEALTITRQRFIMKFNKSDHSIVTVQVEQSRLVPCLQAVDYVLWALQRFYALGEDRFIDYVWDKVGLVLDLDDKQRAVYGTYYTQKDPLSLAKTANRRI